MSKEAQSLSLAVPFFDPTRGHAEIEAQLVEAFLRVIRGGKYILGPEVQAFETDCQAYLGAEHAIGVSSGTDALLVALMALGIGPGDEVICPAFSFIATASTIARTGAIPIFADITADSFNVDPESVAQRITPRTRAIVAVHLFGQCAPMNEILALANAHGLAVIEDAAQAFGAYHHGKRAGTLGTLGCFSFFPTKNLGGFGDGGLVTTNDADLAQRIRMLRVQGAQSKHQHQLIGGNFRLDAVQAALLRIKLHTLDSSIARRRQHALAYVAQLHDLRLTQQQGGCLGLPFNASSHPPDNHIFHQFVIRVGDPWSRDELQSFLRKQGIATEVYYPLPLHHQPCFANFKQPDGGLPAAESACRQVLALPIFAELSSEEREVVVKGIAQFPRG